MNYLFTSLPKISYGIYSIHLLKENLKSYRGKKLLIITEPLFNKLDLLDNLETIVKMNNIEYHIHFASKIQVRLDDIDGDYDFRGNNIDLIIGIGSEDLLNYTKFIAVFLTNGKDLFHRIKTQQHINKNLPTILIPTTFTTGNEVSPRIYVEKFHLPAMINHLFFVPSLIVYDPKILVHLTPYERASLSLSILSHALESFFIVKENRWLVNFSIKSILLLLNNIVQVTYKTNDLNAQQAIMKAGMLIGVATHSNQYDSIMKHFVSSIQQQILIPKELIVAVLLPYTLDIYREINHKRGHKLVQELGLNVKEEEYIYTYIKIRLANLIRTIGFPTKLSSLHIKKDELPKLAENAYLNYVKNNKSKNNLEKQLFHKIYEDAYYGKIKSFY